MGGEKIEGAVVRTELYLGFEHKLGSRIEADVPALQSQQSWKVTVPVRAVQPGRQTIDVTVSATGLSATTQAVVVVEPPPLELHLNGPGQRCRGRLAKFDIEVDNLGSKPAINVRLSATVPENLAFASAGAGGSYGNRTRQIRWLIPSLEAGQRLGFSLSLLGERAGQGTIHAVAQAGDGPEVSADADLRIDAEMPLLLEVSDLDDPVKLGGETFYEIRLLNQAPCAAINLTLQAFVPAGLLPLEVTGPTRGTVQGQQVTFLPLPKLAPHAEVLYRIKVRGAQSGDWRLVVQVSGGQLHIPLADEENTRVNPE
jgi:uncharacterized repeat protein (TIGR01451 family)